MQKSRTQNSLVLLVVFSLVTLPGCKMMDWVKEKLGGDKKPVSTETSGRKSCPTSNKSPQVAVGVPEDGTPILATMNGKPLVTEASLQKEKEELVESNPQLKAMLTMMDPKQLNMNLTQGLTNQAVVSKYIKDNKIDCSPEYREQYDRMLKSVENMLNTKCFTESFTVEVTDAQARDFYEKGKDTMPELLLSRGGVRATGVKFASQEKAQEFAAAVKAAKSIDKAADQAGLKDKVEDFKMVNAQSVGTIEPALRDKIVALKTFPTTQVMKAGDNDYWVVSATAREENKYRPFEQVEAGVKQYLAKQEETKKFEQEIEKLKSQYKVVINESYFGADSDIKQPAQAKMAHAETKDNKKAVAPKSA